jgi:outer membrane protein assembly factor BamD
MALSAVLVLLLGGCSLLKSIFGEKEEPELPPDQLMSDGIESFDRGFYEDATQAFEKIKDRYPYSRFAVDAELKLADTLYMRARYPEANDAYKDFERLHPRNEGIPYVIYQQGMCHFNQVSGKDRDQKEVLLAKENFERLTKKFPKSEYARRAERKIRQCYVVLAEHELYVGHFYYNKRKYRAALARFRYVVENYPDLGQYHEALEYMAKCTERIPEEDAETRGSWWYRLIYPIY